MQYLLLGLGDLWSLKQIILSIIIQIKKEFSSFKITVEFFWFPLLERCYSVAAFTCWWTFECSLSSFFFFEGRHEAIWLLICFSANPFSVAFKPGSPKFEGRQVLKLQEFFEFCLVRQKRENWNICPPCTLRESQEQLSCYIFCLVPGSWPVSTLITF